MEEQVQISMPGREQKNGTNGTNGSNGTTGYGEATLPEKQGRGGEGVSP